MTDYIEIDIIELPKIYKLKEDKGDKLLEWLYFLENPESEKVKNIMKKNEGVKEAKEKLEEISNDEEMQRIIDWRIEAAELDAASERFYIRKKAREEGIKEGKEEGIKQGIKQGMKEGMKEGRQEEKIEIAKKMKENGINIDVIVEITQLDKEKILQL